MAYTPTGFSSTVSLFHNGGGLVTKQVQLHPTIVVFDDAVGPPVGAQQIMTAWAAAWTGVSELTVPSILISRTYEDAAIVAPTAPEAQGEMMAHTLAYINGFGNKKDALDIWGPLSAIFQSATPGTSGYRLVNLANAALLTYVALFKATGGQFVFSDGELIRDVQPLFSGIRTARASRKG